MVVAISLREVKDTDLDTFFDHQQDEEAQYMAAFISKDPGDRKAFDQHWQQILENPENVNRTILNEKEIVGHIAKFVSFGEPELTYWIGREYWGQGIATQALQHFLNEIKIRPLFARAAKDNKGSIRVLEKCGFELVEYDKGYANARGEEIEEVIMRLN